MEKGSSIFKTILCLAALIILLTITSCNDEPEEEEIKDSFRIENLTTENYPRVDGVQPDPVSLKNSSYPYTTSVYAVIRADLDSSNVAYILHGLLSEPEGQVVIEESGYIPFY